MKREPLTQIDLTPRPLDEPQDTTSWVGAFVVTLFIVLIGLAILIR